MVKTIDAIILIFISFVGIYNLLLADEIDKYSYFIMYIVAILGLIRLLMV